MNNIPMLCREKEKLNQDIIILEKWERSQQIHSMIQHKQFTQQFRSPTHTKRSFTFLAHSLWFEWMWRFSSAALTIGANGVDLGPLCPWWVYSLVPSRRNENFNSGTCTKWINQDDQTLPTHVRLNSVQNWAACHRHQSFAWLWLSSSERCHWESAESNCMAQKRDVIRTLGKTWNVVTEYTPCM